MHNRTPGGLKSLSQSPREAAFLHNPHPFYARARDCGDLIYWPDLDRICAVSHRAVNYFLRHRDWGRETMRTPAPAPWLTPFRKVEAYSLLERDPPHHTRLRAAVGNAFTSRSIAVFEPMIRAAADRLLDRFAAQPSVDLQAAYANILPVITIVRILGLPDGIEADLIGWSRRMVAMYQVEPSVDTERAAGKAAAEFAEFARTLIRDRRRRSDDTLLSTLLTMKTDGPALSDDELTSLLILLLNAGHEATACAIGNAIATIIDHCPPDMRPSRRGEADSLVAEALRWDPPLHMFERHAKKDSRHFGHDFRRGDTIALLLAAAGRDSQIFADSDQFDPARTDGSTGVAFGAGVHYCLGAPLARLEIAIALEQLFARWPAVALAQPIRYADRYHFRSLEALHVRLQPTAR